jgi:hypothetical protein
MHRPRNLWCLLPLLVVLAFSVSGCGGSEHDQMIRRFFNASSMGDNITMANIATVSFDPTKDGRATNVSFVSETPAQTRELKIKDLDKAFKEAQAVESDFSKKKNEYQDKNLDAINRVIKIEQSGKGKVTGKDAEIQAAWTKWRDEQSAYSKKVSEARKALQVERKVADLSLPDHDVTQFDSVVEATKDVTVSANVRTPDGQSVKKTLVLTLQRVVMKDSAGKEIPGKWMITALKEAAAGAGS